MMRAAFILGCQRSGTTMLLDVLARSPSIETFGEGDARVMRDFRLLPPNVLDPLLGGRTDRVLVLKPICDSQWGDALLRRYDDSRALWIYRGVRDVVGSATAKWPGHYSEMMDRMCAEDWGWLGWQVQRAAPEAIETVVDLWRWGELGEADAAAMFWYLRNRLLFDRGLDDTELVQLVRYEDLVSDPAVELERVFDLLGVPFDLAFAAGIAGDRIGKAAGIRLAPRVAALCSELQARLDARHTQQTRAFALARALDASRAPATAGALAPADLGRAS